MIHPWHRANCWQYNLVWEEESMVTLYVRGQRVSWAEAEKALAETPAGVNEIELRNDAGRILARVLPESLARADDPDWVKAITPEEIERRLAEPFMTLEEFKKQQGWT
jgi:hypothetical protein